MQKYDPLKLEEEVLEFWGKNKIYEKLKKKNKGKKYFYFLDGPPYTSGRVHIGTAWNKILKDTVLRYKRMQGLDVWDRAGYDMHGLPTENAVQKKLNLKDKEDIKKFGITNFVKECRKLALENMELMTKDFTRLGVWMDFENAYKPIDDSFIEAEWWLIKKADENNRLYEGKRTMHWCPNCATAVAKHELEYKNIKDDAVFVKFPIIGSKREFLIIFTTTPWTIPFNLAVMVNPDVTYVKAKVDDEIWIVAKPLAASLISGVANKNFKILEEVKGKELEGLKYIHPFSEFIPQFEKLKKNDKVHTIVLSKEYVDTKSGSGLVHCAPGCGQEDYEVGHHNNIPPFNVLDETGKFPTSIKKFAGLIAKKDDKIFIEELDNKKVLIAVTTVEHDYPHCWRCHNPVIFRTTTQWFFKVEDLKENMKELNKGIYWVPEWAGSRQFNSWLDNLRDNSITKQRYWGTPLPVWKCKQCNSYIVIASLKELKKLAGKLPQDLHKPWIDKIKIKCERCGGIKERIPDILDVWVDAGITSWACLNYPQKTELFKKMFPPDFILEGKDQIRGWFNLLFVASIVSMQKLPFKAVYMHGFIQDALGRKMSKSLGNQISPDEVIQKYGADTMRFYVISGTNPGIDLNYNFDDMSAKNKNLTVLWNLHNYLIDYSKDVKIKNLKGLDIEEKYIYSKLNSTIKKVTELFEKYEINEIPVLIEDLFLELSRTYIQLTRDKLALGSKKEKEVVVSTIFNVYLNTLKLLTPIVPFVTEKIYQNLKQAFKLKEESIHHFSWPKYNQKLINKNIERDMEIVKPVIQEILAHREKNNLGLRWPLPKVTIVHENTSSIKRLRIVIKRQTNIKKINLKKGKFSIEIDTNLTKALEQEGFARELMRRIQNLRKKANLKKEDKIILKIQTNFNLGRWKSEIQRKVGAIEIDISNKVTDKYRYSSVENIKNQEFVILFNQV